jgi:type I restriction enzyme S subunit
VNELPSGWAETTVGEVLQFNYGKGLPERDRSGSGFPVYGSNGVVGYHEKAFVSAESLVIGRKGSVGEVHHSRGPCWPIDTTYFVDAFSGMPARFWYYALKGLDLGGLNRATAIPGLNREDVYQVDVVLPPQTEQKRIVDKLDAVLARVEACRERLDHVPAILKRFRQAVLAAATSGKLTKEWRVMRGPNSETMSYWKEITLGDLCERSFYGPRFGKDEYTQSNAGVPTIRTTDMTRDGRIEITKDTPKVVVPQDKVEHFRVQKGDLLVTRTGSIGVMAVFEDDYLAIPSAYLIRFRFSPRVLTRYVFYCLMAPAGQECLGLSATAITQPNVNAEAIKRIEIQLPSIDEQHEIVRRVEALFASARASLRLFPAPEARR